MKKIIFSLFIFAISLSASAQSNSSKLPPKNSLDAPIDKTLDVQMDELFKQTDIIQEKAIEEAEKQEKASKEEDRIKAIEEKKMKKEKNK